MGGVMEPPETGIKAESNTTVTSVPAWQSAARTQMGANNAPVPVRNISSAAANARIRWHMFDTTPHELPAAVDVAAEEGVPHLSSEILWRRRCSSTVWVRDGVVPTKTSAPGPWPESGGGCDHAVEHGISGTFNRRLAAAARDRRRPDLARRAALTGDDVWHANKGVAKGRFRPLRALKSTSTTL
ncbi:hypothetical protein AWB75_04468 [Caballeronia catudaia]|uniref:Uncharacterized protein n=1 Tax=Caballeronia catudaia TaxID=1777136 RepID=A0A158C3Z6_9BURK|nr:hypothetical protein AWB75_04468 [Caballeronia catudaia]